MSTNLFIIYQENMIKHKKSEDTLASLAFIKSVLKLKWSLMQLDKTVLFRLLVQFESHLEWYTSYATQQG